MQKMSGLLETNQRKNGEWKKQESKTLEPKPSSLYMKINLCFFIFHFHRGR